jgi:predicted amidohydrolase
MSAVSVAPIKIAISQLRSTTDKPSNLLTIARLAAEAAANECTFMFLPEVCNYMSDSQENTLLNAEIVPSVGYKYTPNTTTTTKPDTSIEHLSNIASTNHLWLSGTIHEKVDVDPGATNSKVYNTHVILDSSGTLRAKYRKLHLFNIDIPTASPPVKLLESATTDPGTRAAVLHNTPLGTIGLLTCYDLRFSYLSDILRYKSNATTLLYPSAFTVPTGRQMWEPVLRARAAETQCFVVASAQVGQHNAKRRSYGHSLVASPWGTKLCDGGGWDEDKSERDLSDVQDVNVYCNIDLSSVDTVRTSIPVENSRLDAVDLDIEEFN